MSQQPELAGDGSRTYPNGTWESAEAAKEADAVLGGVRAWDLSLGVYCYTCGAIAADASECAAHTEKTGHDDWLTITNDVDDQIARTRSGADVDQMRALTPIQ